MEANRPLNKVFNLKFIEITSKPCGILEVAFCIVAILESTSRHVHRKRVQTLNINVLIKSFNARNLINTNWTRDLRRAKQVFYIFFSINEQPCFWPSGHLKRKKERMWTGVPPADACKRLILNTGSTAFFDPHFFPTNLHHKIYSSQILLIIPLVAHFPFFPF